MNNKFKLIMTTKKTILKKRTFVNAINSIDKLHKKNIEFATNISKCFPNSKSSDFIGDDDHVTTALTVVLKELFNDNNEHSWIEYFLWELDFGRENWRLKSYDENKKEIPLSNPAQLFDFLNNR